MAIRDFAPRQSFARWTCYPRPRSLKQAGGRGNSINSRVRIFGFAERVGIDAMLSGFEYCEQDSPRLPAASQALSSTGAVASLSRKSRKYFSLRGYCDIHSFSSESLSLRLCRRYFRSSGPILVVTNMRAVRPNDRKGNWAAQKTYPAVSAW